MSEMTPYGVRVYADDVSAAVEFYTKVLDLTQITRLSLPNDAEEVLMNFGKDAREAAENRGAQFVIMTQPPGAPQDERGHVVIHTSDVDKALAAFTAAGGSVTFGPEDVPGPQGSDRARVAFVKDPFGNVLEFLNITH